MPRTEDDRERDVEDDEVQQRVQQRPREPEDAVLVLDLQLVADHPDEELAALDDAGEPLPGRDPGPDDRRFAARRAALELWRRGHVGHVTPLGQPQPGSDRAVIGRRLRQHLAAERLDAAPHEDVIDLTVRTARGIRATPHRALPTAHQQADGRTPEVEVARDDLRPVVRKTVRSPHQMTQRREPPRSSTTCAARSPRRASRRSSTVSASALRSPDGIGADRCRSGSGADRAPGTASTPRAPTHRRGARRARSRCASRRGARSGISSHRSRPDSRRRATSSSSADTVFARATLRGPRRGRRRSRARRARRRNERRGAGRSGRPPSAR